MPFSNVASPPTRIERGKRLPLLLNKSAILQLEFAHQQSNALVALRSAQVYVGSAERISVAEVSKIYGRHVSSKYSTGPAKCSPR